MGVPTALSEPGAIALALARALAKGPAADLAASGPFACKCFPYNAYGGGGIRTHEGLRPPVFKTGALNRSATPPTPTNVNAGAVADPALSTPGG